MFVITQRFQKPGPESAFYGVSESYRAHVKANYTDTGKLLSTDVNFDDETKTLIVVNRWTNQAAHEAFMQDPVVIQVRDERAAHNVENGITVTRETQEEPDPT